MNKHEQTTVTESDLLEVATYMSGMVEFLLAEEPLDGWGPKVAVLSVDPLTGERGINLFLVAGDGDETGEWKSKTMKAIARQIFEMKQAPLAAVLACEAWMSRGDRERQAVYPPSADPERIEAIVVAGCTLDRKLMCMGSLTICRRPDNTIRPGKIQRIDIIKDEGGSQGSRAYIVEEIFREYAKVASEWLNRKRHGKEEPDDDD